MKRANLSQEKAAKNCQHGKMAFVIAWEELNHCEFPCFKGNECYEELLRKAVSVKGTLLPKIKADWEKPAPGFEDQDWKSLRRSHKIAVAFKLPGHLRFLRKYDLSWQNFDSEWVYNFVEPRHQRDLDDEFYPFFCFKEINGIKLWECFVWDDRRGFDGEILLSSTPRDVFTLRVAKSYGHYPQVEIYQCRKKDTFIWLDVTPEILNQIAARCQKWRENWLLAWEACAGMAVTQEMEHLSFMELLEHCPQADIYTVNQTAQLVLEVVKGFSRREYRALSCLEEFDLVFDEVDIYLGYLIQNFGSVKEAEKKLGTLARFGDIRKIAAIVPDYREGWVAEVFIESQYFSFNFPVVWCDRVFFLNWVKDLEQVDKLKHLWELAEEGEQSGLYVLDDDGETLVE